MREPWQRQWERVERAFKWVDRYTQHSTHAEGEEKIEDREDRIVSFFLHCYHLKDWLRNDPATKTKAAKIEDELRDDPVMQIVGDVANGEKHYDLTTGWYGPRTGDPTTALKHTSTVSAMGTTHATYVESNDARHPAYDVAVAAMAWWHKWFTAHELKP